MANNNPFLAWLRGIGREEEPVKPKPQAEGPPASAEAPDRPELDPCRLELPPGHAMHKLWSLWAQEAGWEPTPHFTLKGPRGGVPEGSLQQELMRLKMVVNISANQRLAEFPNKGEVPPKVESPENSEGQEPEEPLPPPDLDAKAEVFVTTDGMSAWLFAYPPSGQGKELDRDMLSAALESAQVREGVDKGLLTAIPKGRERYFHLHLVAKGTEVVHGQDGKIIDMFPRRGERKIKVDENNRVDYAAISFVQNVSEGEVICRVVPPTRGEQGCTVLGKVIKARDGKAAAVPKGRNTDLTEDGSALVATKTGHVEFNGRTFQVRPVLEVNGNVDYSSGNINFLGDVHVHGDICTGFTVRAMGNITVDGVVEASTVEAGDDLIIVKGAQGDNRAVLRASRSIYAKYLENCCVYAMENIQADCLINCNVYCGGGVSVESGRGTIVGGSVRCAHEVSASIVGSRGECRTDIALGGLPCQEFDQEVLTQEIAELELELAATEQQPESPTKFSRMGKMRMQLSVNRNKLEQFRRDLEQLGEEEEPGVKRLTCGVAYPGTTVSIGNVQYRFQRETRPVIAALTESGEIEIA